MKIIGKRPPNLEWAVISTVFSIVAISSISVLIVGIDPLASSLNKFGPGMLCICLLLLFWQISCRFSRWFFFMRRLGLKIPIFEAALFYVAGMGLALTPGRFGEASRLWFLEKRLSVPYRRIAGLYVADRVGDVLAYLILLAVGAVTYAQGVPIAWSAVLLIFAVILLLMKPRLLIGILTAVYAQFGRGRRLVLWARRAIRNTAALFQLRIFVPGVLLGTIGWLAAPVVLAVSLSHLGVNLDLLRVTFIYAAAALAGGATMMPGGGGATEAVLVSLLTASDTPIDIAVSAMIVTRLTFLLLPVGMGILLFPFAMKLVRKPAVGIDRG